MYVYIKSEPSLWTAGFYSPDGKWHPESDYGTKEAAASRVHYLNGGKDKGGMMKEFKATYTPRKYDDGGMRMPETAKARVVLIVKICEPTPEENPQVVFIDADGSLDMDTMDCFHKCIEPMPRYNGEIDGGGNSNNA